MNDISDKLGFIVEDTELVLEPEGYFKYNGNSYPFWGNPSGRLKTIDYDIGKFNRYAKFGFLADELEGKFRGILKSDPRSLDARCSFACLMMMKYGIRVGNDESASGYKSGMVGSEGDFVQTYGITTLLNKHVDPSDNNIVVEFLGKSQVEHTIVVDDPIYKYGKFYKGGYEESRWLGISYEALFDFVEAQLGRGFIPKDFRTFCANTQCWDIAKDFLNDGKVETKTEVNDEVKRIVEHVSNVLGNTPGVAKNSYLDSRFIDWFKSKRLAEK